MNNDDILLTGLTPPDSERDKPGRPFDPSDGGKELVLNPPEANGMEREEQYPRDVSPEEVFGGSKEKAPSPKRRSQADILLLELGRQSGADRYNFICFFLPAILILVLSLSFILISRGDIEEDLAPLSYSSIADGSYTKSLNAIYEERLPFLDSFRKIAGAIGFIEAEAAAPQEDGLPDSLETPGSPETPETPAKTDPPAEPETPVEPETPSVTQPPESEAPEDSGSVTLAPVDGETQEDLDISQLETFTMYSTATLYIRLGPSTEDAILGYFTRGEEVSVVDIDENGWARVITGGHIAYSYSEYLSYEPVPEPEPEPESEAEPEPEDIPLADPPEDEEEIVLDEGLGEGQDFLPEETVQTMPPEPEGEEPSVTYITNPPYYPGFTGYGPQGTPSP